MERKGVPEVSLGVPGGESLATGDGARVQGKGGGTAPRRRGSRFCIHHGVAGSTFNCRSPAAPPASSAQRWGGERGVA